MKTPIKTNKHFPAAFFALLVAVVTVAFSPWAFSAPPANQPPPANQLDRLHYHFGHRHIPEIIFRNNGEEYRTFLQRLSEASTDKVRDVLLQSKVIYFTSHWKSLAKRLGATDDNIPPPTGFALSHCKLNNGINALIFTFPPPRKPPENYHAALFVDTSGTLRYLTYERFSAIYLSEEIDKLSKELNISVEEAKKRFAAIICEWTPDGRHHNYGMPGSADKAAFESLLGEFLEKKRSPGASSNIPKTKQPAQKSPKQPAPKNRQN